MNLETWSHIAGIAGLIALLFSAFMAYRKKLLHTGFLAFRNQYRIEMDAFQASVLSKVDLFKEIMNKNDERYTKHLDRITGLIIEGQKSNLKTQKAVEKQSSEYLISQVKKEGDVKVENAWKLNIKNELNKVQKDVAHIKDVINHTDK